MEKARKLVMEIVSRYALPIIYTIVIVRLIIVTYMPEEETKYTLICLTAICLLFALFEWLKKRKIFRGVVYMALFVLAVFIFIRLLSSGYQSSRTSYEDWFYVDTQTIGQIDDYFHGTLIFLTFFLTSIVYYFTIIRYRASGTLLAMLYPLFMYAKRADVIPPFDLTVMITVFMALMVHSRLITAENKGRVIINRQYAAALALFVAVVGAVTMFLPQTDAMSKLEADKTYFDLNLRNNYSNYNSLNDTSSLRFGGEDEGIELFRFTPSDNNPVYYLRNQGYDRLRDDERWEMLYDEYNYDTSDVDYRENEANSPIVVYNTMKELADTGLYESMGLDPKAYSEDIFSQKSKIEYSTLNDFAPRYLPVPVTVDSASLKDYNRITHGEVFPEALYHQQEPPLLNTEIEFYPENDEVRRAAQRLSMSYDDFEGIAEAASQNADLRESFYTNILLIHGRYTDLSDYYPSDRMTQLAESIVEGKTTDYEKAQAFVDYFEENGFRYDKEYVPSDESIDYFLFDSKRGSCTSYATSMTIMARLIGLPARYVEGFVAYERTTEGEYIVRDSNAHAWVEVYISGFGWMTFDPTIADYQSSSSQEESSFNIAGILAYLGRIAIFLGVVFIIIFVLLLDRIIEVVFRISLHFRSSTERVLRLYRRTLKLLSSSSGTDLSGYTPHELLEFMRRNRQADLAYVVELFEYTCFGSHEPTGEEWSKAYTLYKAEYKKLRKQPVERGPVTAMR